jgi:hypothetical protein
MSLHVSLDEELAMLTHELGAAPADSAAASRTAAMAAAAAAAMASWTDVEYDALAPIDTSGGRSFPSAGFYSMLTWRSGARLGVRHGHASMQGCRPTMEDEVVRYDVIRLREGALNGISGPVSFYAVLDGHGGSKCSKFALHHLVRNVVRELEGGSSPRRALHNAYLRTDADYLTRCGTVRHCAPVFSRFAITD